MARRVIDELEDSPRIEAEAAIANARLAALQGSAGVWELTWAADGRATFEYGEETHIVWCRVGTTTSSVAHDHQEVAGSDGSSDPLCTRLVPATREPRQDAVRWHLASPVPNPYKQRDLSAELAGLEPATSWVLSRRPSETGSSD